MAYGLWILVAFFTLLPVSVPGAELREMDFAYYSPMAAWAKGRAHVVCKDCKPPERLSYVPANYADSVIRIRVPGIEHHASPVNEPKERADPEKEKPVPEREKETAGTETITVYFELDSFELKEPELEKLKRFAVSTCPEGMARIEITGYTCDLGTQKHNDVLAMKRAEVVYLALLKLNIPGGLIRWAGKGRCCYASSYKAWNRRAEVILYKKTVKGGENLCKSKE